MKEEKIALKVDDKDNVATVFSEGVGSGTAVKVRDKRGVEETVSVIGDIPYGHKLALADISKGDPIVKYGQSIGAASARIRKGEYVHVHNMEAMRGRGDL